MVKALDCGVRGHRFKSHQLLPIGRVFHLDFLLEFSLPTGKDLIQATLCFLSNPAPRGKIKFFVQSHAISILFAFIYKAW